MAGRYHVYRCDYCRKKMARDRVHIPPSILQGLTFEGYERYLDRLKEGVIPGQDSMVTENQERLF